MPDAVQRSAERLDRATYYLAIGAGDIRSRLRLAGTELIGVGTEELPDWLRSEFEGIVSALTRNPAREGFDGSLAATLHGMHRTTGVAIAERIWTLRYRVACSLKPDGDFATG